MILGISPSSDWLNVSDVVKPSKLCKRKCTKKVNFLDESRLVTFREQAGTELCKAKNKLEVIVGIGVEFGI